MINGKQLNIYIENVLIFQNFYYSYNDNSTFNDLLETIAFLFPQYNICPCFDIYFAGNNMSCFNSEVIEKNTKIQDFVNNNIFIYNFINRDNNKKCNCDQIYKDNFRISKNDIIKKYKICLEKSEEQNKCINFKNNKISNWEKKYNELNKENKKLKKQITELKKKINYLNNEIKTNKNNINNLESDINNKNNEIKTNENNINNLESDINNKNNELKKLKSDINNINKNYIKLEKEKKDLEKNTFNIVEKYNLLHDKNNIANKEIKKMKNQIKKQNKENQIDKEKIEDLTLENKKLIEEKLKIEKTNKETNFIDFYDVIVDIKSIKDISKGWEIKMSNKAKDNYDTLKTKDVIKIGVIGNANKGKSFLLSKISKITLPSGTSIRTEGLSIKYPDLEKYINKNIVLLDSAGLETPVLKEEKENKNENENIDDINNKENNEKEYFREKSREKLITELFLQNYIINTSDILIVVVGILTYSEQKLLNRIKTELIKIKNKTKADKPLYIVHNLMSFKTIGQVEEYIKDFLLKSATFDLREKPKTSTSDVEKTGVYFYENITNQTIYHLIFAQDGSVAGNFYNNLTLEFFENSYQQVIHLKSYDIIETLKDCFIDLSKDILERNEKIINKNDFENENNLLKLKVENEIILKKCFIDELGFSSLKANGFEPTYNYYKKENKIIIRIEVPGNYSLKSSIEYLGEYNFIKINGSKNKDKEPVDEKDNIDNTRVFGKFSVNIPLRAEEYPIKNSKPEKTDKKGIIFLEYELEEKGYGVEFEEEEDV